MLEMHKNMWNHLAVKLHMSTLPTAFPAASASFRNMAPTSITRSRGRSETPLCLPQFKIQTLICVNFR